MSYEKAEVLFPDPPNFISCTCCNKTFDINIENKESEFYEIMRKHQVCFNCAYWMNLVNNRPDFCEVIGGVLYIANLFVHRPYHVIKGSLGKEFYIRKFNGLIIRTNNLWKLGKVPDRFKDHFPDTAHFLPLMVYQKICKDPHMCNARGCWDRYHCLRYNHENEKDGPFNTIPTSHKIGDERCPSFININKLKL